MNVKTLFLFEHKWQPGKKLPLPSVKLTACPLYDDLSFDVEVCPRVADRTVMVPQHGDRPLLDQLHDGRHDPAGVGTVAHIIAEQDNPLRSLVACLSKAGAERLPICVYVRKEGYAHSPILPCTYVPNM